MEQLIGNHGSHGSDIYFREVSDRTLSLGLVCSPIPLASFIEPYFLRSLITVASRIGQYAVFSFVLRLETVLVQFLPSRWLPIYIISFV